MDARRTLIRIVLLALLLYAALCTARLGRELYAARSTAQTLALRLESAELENRALRQKLEGGRSREELEALAWQRLGLVRSGEIVFLFPDREKNA